MHKQKTVKGQKRKRDAELELWLGFPKWRQAFGNIEESYSWRDKNGAEGEATILFYFVNVFC